MRCRRRYFCHLFTAFTADSLLLKGRSLQSTKVFILHCGDDKWQTGNKGDHSNFARDPSISSVIQPIIQMYAFNNVFIVWCLILGVAHEKAAAALKQW